MGAKEGITGDATVKEKTRDRKRPSPTIERVKGCDRAQQSRPNEHAQKVEMLEDQQRIKKIDPGRITQPAESMNWIVRPERHPVGEILDVGDVQREIAEIVRRLNLKVIAVDPKQPTKGADGEHQKDNPHDPGPEMPAPRQRWRLRLACLRVLPQESPAGPL